MNKHQTIGEYIDILGENLYMLKKNPDYKPKGFLVLWTLSARISMIILGVNIL